MAERQRGNDCPIVVFWRAIIALMWSGGDGDNATHRWQVPLISSLQILYGYVVGNSYDISTSRIQACLVIIYRDDTR